jgi:DNA-binding SARP family transcriptional activator
MIRLCTRALEHGIEVDYVRSLIRERGLMPEDPPAATDAWPWPLKIYTLGRFDVVKDGKPLALGAGGKRKPLELLMALIALGGSGVSQTKLTDALWPEVEGHLAQQTFEITLHRLRKLIGQEPALVLKDGKLSLDARHCWVDSWACEHLLDRIERALHESPARPEDVDRLARKLLALYQGPFLATEAEQPWLLTPRERLRSKFLRLFGALGRHWEADGKWDRAANGYLQGLEVDPLAEELYRSLMRCYRQQGRPAEARAVYARCCNTLKTILGVGPSPQTETLRRAIDAD